MWSGASQKKLVVNDFARALFVVALVHVSGASSVVLNCSVEVLVRLLAEASLFCVVDVAADLAIDSLEHEARVHIVDLIQTEDFVV